MLCGKVIVKPLLGLSQMPSGACLEHFPLSHFVWNVIDGCSICCQSLCSCCLEYYSKMFTSQRCLMSGTSYSYLSLFLGGVIWTCSVFFFFFLTYHRCSDKPERFLQSPHHCLCFQGEFGPDLKVTTVKRMTESSISRIKKVFPVQSKGLWQSERINVSPDWSQEGVSEWSRSIVGDVLVEISE